MTRRLIDAIVRAPEAPTDLRARERLFMSREWLVTNGIGGYASGSVSGSNTRRYHGILVAALPNPLGRLVMVNCLHETVAGATGQQLTLDGTNAASVIRGFRL